MKKESDYIEEAKRSLIKCYGDVYERKLNGEDILVEKDALMQCDINTDTFLLDKDYCYVSNVFTAIFDYGSKDKIEEARNELEDHFLYTDIPCVDGMLYIKRSSVREIKKKRGRR